MQSLPIGSVEDIRDAFDRAAGARTHAVVVLSSPLIFAQRLQIAELALKAGLPTISPFTLFPKVGGLIAYGPNLLDMFRRAGAYVGRIFQGR